VALSPLTTREIVAFVEVASWCHTGCSTVPTLLSEVVQCTWKISMHHRSTDSRASHQRSSSRSPRYKLFIIQSICEFVKKVVKHEFHPFTQMPHLCRGVYPSTTKALFLPTSPFPLSSPFPPFPSLSLSPSP